MQKKKHFFQFAQLCSQIVFQFFGVGFKNADFCWNHYNNCGFSIFLKGKKAQKCQKGWLGKWHFLSYFPSSFWKSHSPCRKKRNFEKPKWKNKKLGPSFDPPKGYFWTKVWLYSICAVSILSLSLYVSLMYALSFATFVRMVRPRRKLAGEHCSQSQDQRFAEWTARRRRQAISTGSSRARGAARTKERTAVPLCIDLLG